MYLLRNILTLSSKFDILLIIITELTHLILRSRQKEGDSMKAVIQYQQHTKKLVLLLLCSIVLISFHTMLSSHSFYPVHTVNSQTDFSFSNDNSVKNELIAPTGKLYCSYLNVVLHRITQAESKSVRFAIRLFFSIPTNKLLFSNLAIFAITFLSCILFTVLYHIIHYIHKTDGKSRPFSLI